MFFDKLVLNNFGVFNGRHEIVLTTQPPLKPIILIGAQNGGGKTTILDALQLVLYGKFARCSKRGTLAYNKFLKGAINKNASTKEGAALELTFRQMEEGVEHYYRVNRSWFQNGKSLKEVVEVFKDDEFDKIITESWHEYVEELIPANISHLFFFDGEKIEGYADEKNSSDLLGTAIHSLLGLDLVKQLHADLTILERKQRVQLKPQLEQETIKVLELELANTITQRAVIAQNKASKVTALEQQQVKLDRIEEELRLAGGELLKDRQKIEDERKTIAAQYQAIREKSRQLATGAAPLLLVRDMLQEVSAQASREKLAQEAKTIHVALTGRDEALLACLKQKNTPENIINSAVSFLTKDRNSRLKKAAITNYLNLSSSTHQELDLLLEVELPRTKEEISAQTEEVLRFEGELVAIDRRLGSLPDEESVAELIAKRDEIQALIKDIQSKVDELDHNLTREKRAEEAKRKECDRLVRKAVQTDIDNDDVSRTITYAAQTVSTLKRFKDELTKHHSRNISHKVLECFQQLIRKDTLIKELYIDPTTFKIEMIDGDGHVLSPNNLSAGERQLLATSILWALAEVTGRPLPVIIDTPLGRLDSTHRSFLIERYFPKASHQVILLSTDEEIDKELVEILEPSLCRKYLLEYSDETRSSNIKQGYFF